MSDNRVYEDGFLFDGAVVADHNDNQPGPSARIPAQVFIIWMLPLLQVL